MHSKDYIPPPPSDPPPQLTQSTTEIAHETHATHTQTNHFNPLANNNNNNNNTFILNPIVFNPLSPSYNISPINASTNNPSTITINTQNTQNTENTQNTQTNNDINNNNEIYNEFDEEDEKMSRLGNNEFRNVYFYTISTIYNQF